MIKINVAKNTVIQEGEEVVLTFPERNLTPEEQATVTSTFCNGVEYIYYQGDEPNTN